MQSPKKFDPVCKGLPHLIHGGDYNPDQWLDAPQVLEQDQQLMRLAHMNSATVAIFAWSALEPQEGVYTFDWLDETMERLHKSGMTVILATPSGARPAWMDRDHPEVLRMGADRVRNLHGGRHNHCYTAPYYREKVRQMNSLLARRYGGHPALGLWHVSNEYGGECHCPLCQAAFRAWLRERYQGDIEALNHQWWTGFWSRRFASFEEIESPAPHGETAIHGLELDWKRFVTYQTRSFLDNEVAALRQGAPGVPVTTNLMGTYPGLDPWKLAGGVDVISWDNYPRWHSDEAPTSAMASDIAFVHDLNRSLKKQPFLLMESTPSQVNWMPVNKLKRPGMHILSSLQAVAHGSDSVQYFQWRQGRGAFEKFHGAVVSHCGHSDTRVFREVAALGEMLEKLDGVVGTCAAPRAALIYDWENDWAIKGFRGFNDKREYEKVCKEHYRALWRRSIPVDVIDMEQDFSGYRLIAAPMLYLLKPGVAQRLKAFVRAGGDLVLTWLTGYVNENDLCWQGGFPGDGLMELCGLWNEETDGLYPTDRNQVVFGENPLGLTGSYEAFDLCELIHPQEDCQVLATYGSDFYQGRAAVTLHPYGAGRCFYLAARTGPELADALYSRIAAGADLAPAFPGPLPEGVSAQRRSGGGEDYLFLLNFTEGLQQVEFPACFGGTDLLTSKPTGATLALPPYGATVVRLEGGC